MTQSRFFTKKESNNYTLSSLPALEAGHKKGLLLVKDYDYTPDLEAFMQRYAKSPQHGVQMKLVEAHESPTGKSQIHIVLHPPLGSDFSETEKEFRTAAAKLGYMRGHHSKDSEEILEAFKRYMALEDIQSLHAARTHVAPQLSRDGNAF